MSNSPRVLSAAIGLFCVFALLGGCSDDDGAGAGGIDEPDKKYGESCTETAECRDDLICESGTCAAEGNKKEGADCKITAECADGLYCDPFAGELSGKCQPAGEGEAGDPCGGDADCKSGLTCKADGLGGVCAESGDGDVGSACETSTDCLAGLNCSAGTGASGNKECRPGPAGRPNFYEGVECAEAGDGPPRVYFEVPDDPASVTEFYRLPFPNDIRTSKGQPNLAGHPTPGKEPLGFDIVQTYVDAISSKQTGFGLQQTVYFRFSETIKFKSLKAGGDNQTVRFLNVTKGSPGYDQGVSYSWQFSSGRNKYICPNWLGVRVALHRPLEPKTTYAVVLSKGVVDEDGNAVEASEDFEKMLADQKPGGKLGSAWEAYAPLRDWVADRDDIAADDLIAAAVFTTGAPRQPVRKLRAPARSKTPTAKDLTLCEEGATSPCDDGFEDDRHERGCFGTREKFHEIQGKISLPVFQKGKRPYLEKGGGVEFENGTGVVQNRRDVCMTMTVPKSTGMPADGWPLVIYAPGTGATARDVVDDLAADYSVLGDGADQTGVMMMSWEQVQHFRRRGDSESNPERLVFNYGNPDAAMGNFLQGAADVFAVVEWAENFSLDAASSPTGEEIAVDADRIYFVGHSQGGTTGPLALPYEPGIDGAILSGAGAGLVHSLLGKTSPHSVPDGVKLVLHETNLSQWHPVLSLLQAFFNPVDPVNHAAYVAARHVPMETTPHHVFHMYGTGDTFTPPEAIETMARALRVEYIEPTDFQGATPQTTGLPASGNLQTDESSYTGVGRQYDPGDYDGHFVFFRNDEARDDVREFLTTGIVDGTPEIAD